MVVEMLNESFYKVIELLPPILNENAQWIVAVLKAIGVLALAYLVYLVIMLTINLRKVKQLGRIKNRMEAMDSKLDLLLKDRKIKIPRKLNAVPSSETFWEKLLKRYES
tara:strand:+ start:161 stop:487 length:327 start_codon:yes stop_codon:yes gene_type:complete